MIYSDYQGKQLPLLGFGAMRLPVTAEGGVDEKTVEEMRANKEEARKNAAETDKAMERPSAKE